MRPQFLQVQGVAEVVSYGGLVREIHVDIGRVRAGIHHGVPVMIKNVAKVVTSGPSCGKASAAST